MARRTEPRPAQKTTRRQRTAAIQRNLVQAADWLFATRGFETTTVGRIADVAGVTTGALYSSFERKEDLLFAVIEARSADDDFTRTLDFTLAPADQLAGLVSEFAGGSAGREELERLESDLVQVARDDLVALELVRQLDDQKRAALVTWLQAEEAAGRVKPARPLEHVAAYILALVRDLARQHARDPAGVPASSFADAFAPFLHGPRRRSRPAAPGATARRRASTS